MHKLILSSGIFILNISLIIHAYPLIANIGWIHLIIAILIQFIWLKVISFLITNKGFGGSTLEEDKYSYRSYFSVGWVGFLIVTLLFSLVIFYMGLVCPDSSLPMVRGKPLCAG